MDDEESERFEMLVLPHLDAGYNLARWLVKRDADAQDMVQEAAMRAMRYFASFHGDQARAWWLQIVRNTCFAWLKEHRPIEVALHDLDGAPMYDTADEVHYEPDAMLERSAARMQMNDAISALPIDFREVLVLRELKDLSYKDIARITDTPVGTVMSRLARARGLLRLALGAETSAGEQYD